MSPNQNPDRAAGKLRLTDRVGFWLKSIRQNPQAVWQVLFVFPWLYLGQRFLNRPIILVYRPSGIGDIICTFPSVGTLKRRLPEARVVYVAHARNVSLVQLCPYVDVTVAEGSLMHGPVKRIVDAKRFYHPVLPDECQPRKPRQKTHLTEEFSKSFGLDSLDETATQLEVSAPALKEVKERLRQEKILSKPLVVIHTGPTWKVKEWPVEKWRELIAALQAEGKVAVIQIGEDTTSAGEQRLSPRVTEAANWIGKLTIDQTMALLSLADLFVGLDSGALHMAGAVNASVVGLFGPTLAQCYLPKSNRAVGVTSHVPCLGCHHESPQLHWHDGCPYDIRCMAELSVEAVLAACVKLLAKI